MKIIFKTNIDMIFTFINSTTQKLFIIYIINVWLKPCSKRLLLPNRRSKFLGRFINTFYIWDQWGAIVSKEEDKATIKKEDDRWGPQMTSGTHMPISWKIKLVDGVAMSRIVVWWMMVMCMLTSMSMSSRRGAAWLAEKHCPQKSIFIC
jgi:hypothetical protein